MQSRTIIIVLSVMVIAAEGGYNWMTSTQQKTVQIYQKGSDIMLVLAQNWTEACLSNQSE